MKSLSQIIESVDINDKDSVHAALHESIGDTGITSGGTVAVLDDPTFAFAGQTGKVVSIDDKKGVAKVQFPNGSEAYLQSTLLIPV